MRRSSGALGMSRVRRPAGQGPPPTSEGSSRHPGRSPVPEAEASDPTRETRAEQSSTAETMFYRILDLAKKLSVPNTAKKKS